MAKYTAISIIYNPNSTGPSSKLAKELGTELKKQLPKVPIAVIPTKRAGHAEQLAYESAKASAHPLIISSSGDGGYHEVVNGLLRAQASGAQPTAALLPAGNANDHYRSFKRHELVPAIVADKAIQTIDVMKLDFVTKGAAQSRYAHSYIGLGLTPEAGSELNKHVLNRFNQIWLVAKIILSMHPIKLRVHGKVRTYQSLIFSNVPKMSKILTVSAIASARDGKFEISSVRRNNRFGLIFHLVSASTRGLRGKRQAKSFRFETVSPTLVQLDGEVHTIDANTVVHVSIAPKTLRCII